MSEVPNEKGHETAQTAARKERDVAARSEADTRQGPLPSPEAGAAGDSSPFDFGSTLRISSQVGETAPASAPRRFGKYDLVGKIGSGGFGVVLRGRDPHLQRDVAIKISTTENAELSKRFLREAKIAARFQHPNIVTIFDFGYENGVPFMVQELLDGEDLAAVLARGDGLPVARQVDVLRQVARGMAYAHGQGVLHRDIKPPNVRLLSDGQVKILDFGIARLVDQTSQLTATDMKIGTAAYMAPEQLSGGEAAAASDIFAFGVLAYEVMSGKHPFAADTISRAFFRILNEAPTTLSEIAPGCPSHVVALVDRCLAKDPADRPASFEAIVEQLEQPIGSATASSSTGHSEPAPAPPVAHAGETPQPAPPRASSSRYRVAAIAAAIAVPLVGGLAWLSQRSPTPPPPSTEGASGQPADTLDLASAPSQDASMETAESVPPSPSQPASTAPTASQPDSSQSNRPERGAVSPETDRSDTPSRVESPEQSTVRAQTPPGNPVTASSQQATAPGSGSEEARSARPDQVAPPSPEPAGQETATNSQVSAGADRAREPSSAAPEQPPSTGTRVAAEEPTARVETRAETAGTTSGAASADEAADPPSTPPVEPEAVPLFRAGEVGVRPPAATVRPTPEYPARAQRRGKVGVVEVAVLVDEHGKVLQSFVRKCSAPGLGFEEAALAAADQTIFQPARRGIQIGRMWTQLTFRFERRR